MDQWFISKQVGMPFVFHQPSLIPLFSHKNIRCIMAYIVDLTVILHGLFLTTRSVSATKAQSAVEDYAKSSSRNQVHEDIGGFVAQTPLTYQNKDIMMEKIIDLIKQNCVQTSS